MGSMGLLGSDRFTYHYVINGFIQFKNQEFSNGRKPVISLIQKSKFTQLIDWTFIPLVMFFVESWARNLLQYFPIKGVLVLLYFLLRWMYVDCLNSCILDWLLVVYEMN